MNTKTATRSEIGFDDIRREHLELEELQSKLLKTLAERREPSSRIVQLLTAIHERVKAHFADEETGVIRAGAVGNPDLAVRCEQLCNEHHRLSEQLDGVLATVDRLENASTTTWWHDVEDAFRDFSVALTNHENREQALIQDILKQA